MRLFLAVLTMSAVGGPALASGVAGPDWAIYANAKYQFQTCYPADLLHGQGESPASDGQVFMGADGAKLTASAIYNVDTETLAQFADETGQRLAAITARSRIAMSREAGSRPPANRAARCSTPRRS